MSSTTLPTFTDQNFTVQVLESSVPVLVMVTMESAAKKLVPILESIAEDFAGRVKVGTLDITNSGQTAMRYFVRTAPTFLVFRDGEKRGVHMGGANREQLLKLLRLG